MNAWSGGEVPFPFLLKNNFQFEKGLQYMTSCAICLMHIYLANWSVKYSTTLKKTGFTNQNQRNFFKINTCSEIALHIFLCNIPSRLCDICCTNTGSLNHWQWFYKCFIWPSTQCRYNNLQVPLKQDHPYLSGCVSLAFTLCVGPHNSLQYGMAFSLASTMTIIGPLLM